jgi:DNA-binding MarR family transcriptional regulator
MTSTTGTATHSRHRQEEQKKIMRKDELIFRINRVIRAIEETTGLSELDLASRAILNFIGEAESQDRLLNVSDVVKGPGFGTAPTVYSRIAELERGGWIKCVQDPNDGRAKHVRLTPSARKAFAKMSSETQKLFSQKSRA